MDLLSFLIVVSGIALAIHELWPVLANWRKRDREWWSGLCWGLVGLFVAVGGLVTGLTSAADSERTSAELAKAQGAIEGERRARTELIAALRVRHVPRHMDLIEFKGTRVIFVCANDSESKLFTHDLGFELEGQGWRIVGAEIRERVDSGVSVTPLGGPSILFPDAKYDDPAEKARDALVSELEDGGIAVRPGGEMGNLPPNTVKIFVGPSPQLKSLSETFPIPPIANTVEEFVLPAFREWQKGDNAFIKWPEQPSESTAPSKSK